MRKSRFPAAYPDERAPQEARPRVFARVVTAAVSPIQIVIYRDSAQRFHDYLSAEEAQSLINDLKVCLKSPATAAAAERSRQRVDAMDAATKVQADLNEGRAARAKLGF